MSDLEFVQEQQREHIVSELNWGRQQVGMRVKQDGPTLLRIRFFVDKDTIYDSKRTGQASGRNVLKLNTITLSLQPICDEVTQHEPIFAAVKKQAEKVLASTESCKERERVQHKLNFMEARWEKVQKTTADRQTLLEQMEPVALEYQEAVQELLPWITVVEKKIASLQSLPCDKKVIERFEQVMKDIEGEFEARQENVKALNQVGKSMIELRPEDLDNVKAQVIRCV